jgi:DNA-directed RNA polymerase specialized sigma24 family protein
MESLMLRVKSCGDSVAFEKIWNATERAWMRLYRNPVDPISDIEDVKSHARMAVVKACSSWERAKSNGGNPSSWVITHAQFAVKRFFQDNTLRNRSVGSDLDGEYETEVRLHHEDPTNGMDIGKIENFLLRKADRFPRGARTIARAFIKAKVVDPATPINEVAASLGVTPQAVQQVISERLYGYKSACLNLI